MATSPSLPGHSDRGRSADRLRSWVLFLILILWMPLVGAAESLDELESQPASWAAAGITVHGTLTLPVRGDELAAVLLIAGSGPSDRDWNSPGLAGENGSGRLIARALAARGVAVLRYDKRGTGETQASPPHTWDDFTAEQTQGLEVLRRHARVDAKRIYVVGHSEGALHALRLSQQRGAGLAGVGLLVSPGRSMGELIRAQYRSAHEAAGHVPQAADLTLLDSVLDSVRSGSEQAPQPALDHPQFSALTRALFDPTEHRFLSEILDFDPRSATARLKIPLLLVGAGKDVQLDQETDLSALSQAARRSMSPRVRIHRLALADHMLKLDRRPLNLIRKAGRAPAYNDPTRTLDPAVVSALLEWIEADSKS